MYQNCTTGRPTYRTRIVGQRSAVRIVVTGSQGATYGAARSSCRIVIQDNGCIVDWCDGDKYGIICTGRRRWCSIVAYVYHEEVSTIIVGRRGIRVSAIGLHY